MRYRTLGRTGLRVSVIGLGGGGIGQVWGATTDDECLRVVRRAVDLGVTVIDVAPSYGRGKAEEIVGRAGPEVRRAVTLATKVRAGLDERDNIGQAIRASLEASLRRLNTDAVDLLQLHNRIRQERQPADPGSLSIEHVLGPGGVLETMQALRQEGKTRFLGITGYGDYDGVAAVIESGAFDTVQAHYSLLNQASIGRRPIRSTVWPIPSHVIPLAKAHGMGVIGIRPLEAGALSAALDRDAAPDSELAADFGRAQTLRFLVQGEIRTLAEAALVFAAMNEQIATVVPGVKNLAELEEAVAAAERPTFSREELERAAALYARGFAE